MADLMPVVSSYQLRSKRTKRQTSCTVDMAHPAPNSKRTKAALMDTDTEQQPNLLLDLPDNALDAVLEALPAKELAVLQTACSPRQLTVRGASVACVRYDVMCQRVHVALVGVLIYDTPG